MIIRFRAMFRNVTLQRFQQSFSHLRQTDFNQVFRFESISGAGSMLTLKAVKTCQESGSEVQT